MLVPLGSVRCQPKKIDRLPNAYRILNAAKRNYSITEKQCVVISALNKIRYYFNELPVKAVTDHSALTELPLKMMTDHFALTKLTNGKGLASEQFGGV